MKKLLCTGCLGFIGSHFVKYTLDNFKDVYVVGVDKDDDAKALRRLDGYLDNPNFNLIRQDLCGDISELLEGVDIVVHFASKTFVDHSFRSPDSHFKNTVGGTFNLLKQVVQFKPLMVQISTDEVYGSLEVGEFTENSPLNPTNPYSACKASADMLVVGMLTGHKLPYIITRTENNYGTYQHAQKVLPVFVKKVMEGEPLPVYGDGKHKRMWLHVEDHCSALWFLINRKARGIYHIAGNQELENIELANKVMQVLDKPESELTFIPDEKIRPTHDKRYAIDARKMERMGWKPKWDMNKGLEETITWFSENQWWMQ